MTINKNYILLFLLLIFTFLSGFSQKYYKNDSKWAEILNSYEFIAPFEMLKEAPFVKNAECKEPNKDCFLRGIIAFMRSELDANQLKGLTGEIYWQFIVNEKGKIKQVNILNPKPENTNFEKEIVRVIKKIELIGKANTGENYAEYKGKNVAFLVALRTPI